jgi:O-antigen/teichoic acid export membrane protein
LFRTRLNQEHARFAHAAAVTIALNGSSLLISGITSILMARVLGIEQLSSLVVFNMGVGTISLFSDFAGVYNASIYLIASREHPFSINTIRGTLIAYGVMSGLLAGLLICFRPIRVLILPPLTGSIWGVLLMIAICGYAVLRHISAVYLGQRDFVRAGLVALMPVVGYAAIATISTVVLDQKTGLSAATAQVGSVLACVAYFSIRLARLGIGYPSLAYIASCFRVGRRAAVNNWLGFLHTRIDQYLVNWICGPAALVFYCIAVAVCELLTRIPGMMGQVIFPLVAAEKGAVSATRKTLRHCIGAIIFTTAISIPVLVFSDSITTILYGAGFAPSIPALRVLLPAAVFMSGVRIVDNHLSGMGYPLIKLMALVVSLAVNIVANLILLPRLGIIGASLASTISYLVWLYIIWIYLWRLSHTSIRDFGSESSIVAKHNSSEVPA